jgi:hypothetical protein
MGQAPTRRSSSQRSRGVNPPNIHPIAITCTRCGGTAANPATDRHATHKPGCTALADFEAAMAGARRIEAEATWQMAVTASLYGTHAVAEAAFVPGGPSVDEIEQHYRDLQARTRVSALPEMVR